MPFKDIFIAYNAYSNAFESILHNALVRLYTRTLPF